MNRCARCSDYAPQCDCEEQAGLLAAARALVKKLDETHESDQYRALWSLAYSHGYNYSGPSYAAELAALRVAIGDKVQDAG